MKPNRVFTCLAALFVGLGCDDSPATPDDAAPSATDASQSLDGGPVGGANDAEAPQDATSGPSDASSGPGDAAGPATCACDPDETCGACIAHIGECCYDDPTLEEQAPLLATTCEGTAACRACCAECEALSCDELKRTGSCPNLQTPASAEALDADNGVNLNGTPLQFIHTGPLAPTAELTKLLQDYPGADGILKYLVECALPEGAEVAFDVEPGAEPLVLHGSIGLAAEWADGPCDVACQEWVSACLFARTNRYGLTVQIYLSGSHPAFNDAETSEGTAAENGFTIREGAYYGNYFATVPHELSCRGDGNDPLYQTIRVCPQPGDLCGFSQVGPCGAVDGDTLLPAPRHACERETEIGDYTDCHDRASLPGSDEFPVPSRTYSRVVTIYVRPSAFQPGIAASGLGTPDGPVACGDAAPEIRAGSTGSDPAKAGDRCVNDDDCRSETLLCDARSQWGFCTTGCVPGDDVSAEAEACGDPTSTCLGSGALVGLGEETVPEGTCTRACRPGAETGSATSCEPGQVCTREWIASVPPDSQAGCTPFCSSNADCPTGVPCYARLGACGGEADETLLPDGAPCDFREFTCRGGCLVVGDQPEEGLCASVINFVRDTECPDDPEHILPLAPGGPGQGDDLAVCIYRQCQADADCPAPLKCLSGILDEGKVCSWQ